MSAPYKADQIANRFFSDAVFRALPPSHKPKAFSTAGRAGSLCKTIGDGLAVGSD